MWEEDWLLPVVIGEFYNKLDAPLDLSSRSEVIISWHFSQELSHLVHCEVDGPLLVVGQPGLVVSSHLIMAGHSYLYKSERERCGIMTLENIFSCEEK